MDLEMVFILDLTYEFVPGFNCCASHWYRAKPDNKILSAESRLNVSADNRAQKNENSNTKQIQQHAFWVNFLLWFEISTIKL